MVYEFVVAPLPATSGDRSVNGTLPMNTRQTGLIPIVPILLAAYAVGPDYHRPSAPVPVPVRFREAEGWKPGEPKEATGSGD